MNFKTPRRYPVRVHCFSFPFANDTDVLYYGSIGYIGLVYNVILEFHTNILYLFFFYLEAICFPVLRFNRNS